MTFYSNNRRQKDISQTHRGFRNAYGILPPEFLAPEHAQVLADIAAEFYHIFFFCRENEAPRDFIASGSQTRVGHVPIEYTFERKGEDEPENDVILALLEGEEGGSSLPLSGYAEEYDSALTFAGNKLRKIVTKLSLPRSGPRYPERILCCGSAHFLNAAWLRSVLRSQQKCALHGQSEALKFDRLIEAVNTCVPSNGLFRVHTTAYGEQFIVSDAEMPR